MPKQTNLAEASQDWDTANYKLSRFGWSSSRDNLDLAFYTCSIIAPDVILSRIEWTTCIVRPTATDDLGVSIRQHKTKSRLATRVVMPWPPFWIWHAITTSPTVHLRITNVHNVFFCNVRSDIFLLSVHLNTKVYSLSSPKVAHFNCVAFFAFSYAWVFFSNHFVCIRPSLCNILCPCPLIDEINVYRSHLITRLGRCKKYC